MTETAIERLIEDIFQATVDYERAEKFDAMYRRKDLENAKLAIRAALQSTPAQDPTSSPVRAEDLDQISLDAAREIEQLNWNFAPQRTARIQVVVEQALRRHAKKSSALEVLIREYARDLRRNSSGGDDYPWEIMRGVADYLETLIARATAIPIDSQ